MVKPAVFTVSGDVKQPEKAEEAGIVEVPDDVACMIEDPRAASTDHCRRRACYVGLGVISSLLLIGAVIAVLLVFVIPKESHGEKYEKWNMGNDALYPPDEEYPKEWHGRDHPWEHGPRRPGHESSSEEHGHRRPGHESSSEEHGHRRPGHESSSEEHGHRRPGHDHDGHEHRGTEPNFHVDEDAGPHSAGEDAGPARPALR